MFEDKDERIADFAFLFKEYHNDVANKYLKNQNLLAYLNFGGFFTSPASTKYHGDYEGGLYDHSRQVAIELEKMTENMGLKWKRTESPFIVGMFHDLCKCDQYKLVYDEDNAKSHYEHNNKMLLTGHGAKSVMILSQFMTLTEEEVLCIRYHMGAYEKEEWNEFDAAIKRYPNVFWTHAADMVASKIRGI